MESFLNVSSDFKAKIFPSIDNILKWKILFIGPQGTIYNKGVYLLYAEFPSDYPFKPPKIIFLTPIYHCNVSSQGSICLDVLKD